MDRIDMQGSKGVLASLKARSAAPVGRVEGTRPAKPDASAAEAVATSFASAGAEPKIDHDRVAEIRKAIEQGRYPVVPTQIADAMIAAGFLLRTK